MAFRLADVVMCYDFESLTPNGLLRDFGPSGLHATFPGGAANPTAQLDGSYYFDGGDYLSISGAAQARFYAVAPTGTHTWLMIRTDTTDNSGAAFSCWDSGAGGTNEGIALIRNNAFDFYLAYQYQGGAATPYIQTPVNAVPATRKMITAMTVETTPRLLLNDVSAAATWGVGAFGTADYDETIIPRIGMHPSAAGPITGYLYYLCLLRGALTNDELSYASRLMAEGVKPFAVRR